MSPLSHVRPASGATELARVSGAPRPVPVSAAVSAAREQTATVLPLARPPAPSPVPEIPPEVEAVARRVARGALEVLGGTRPLQQMSRLLDARSYERLQLRSNLIRSIHESHGGAATGNALRLHRNVIIRSVRICPITPNIFEGSVVAAEQKRARAIALRIERLRGQWRVTELQIG
ncbi:Rv3235 family protein [Arthrobacter sp. 35/47]|uniref:Rv3235 family protein n=1 Tax=Arthrobacter sp. 35/47 TaxID=269454 RepID=UPI0012EC6429|nr:Rv3235 family protein [Arthrobacter sp. 35/47]